MTDAVTDEIKAYLATWLETQDTSTLGHKAVRSHINEHFNTNVDKDAFKSALIEATSQVKNKHSSSSSTTTAATTTTTTTTTTATADEGEVVAPVKRKRKAASKAKETEEKEEKEEKEKGNNDAENDNDNDNRGNAATAAGEGQADDVLNEVFGDDDGDDANADGGADDINADGNAEAAEVDDMEEKLFSKKRSRRVSDGADARAAKRARKKAAAAAAAEGGAADGDYGEEDPKKKKKKDKKKDKKDKPPKEKKKAAKKPKKAAATDDDGEPKPKKKRAAAKKAKRAVVDGDDDADAAAGGGGGDGDADNASAKSMSEVDALLEKMKRKELKSTRTHDEKLDSIRVLLENMNAYAESDAEAVQQNAPAVNKLMHIDEFVEALSKADLQTLFVGNGALPTIKTWLSPLPDGSLPSLKVREQLLRILLILPVERDDLTDSKIGHIVMFLLKHPDETRANRDICEAIVERWSRPIFQRASNHTQVEAPNKYELEATTDGGARPPSSLHGGVAGGHYVPQDEADNPTSLEVHPLTGRVRRPRVHVPRPLKLDFTLQPLSRPEQRVVATPSERKKELISRLNSLKNKHGSAKRLQSVAVSRLEL